MHILFTRTPVTMLAMLTAAALMTGCGQDDASTEDAPAEDAPSEDAPAEEVVEAPAPDPTPTPSPTEETKDAEPDEEEDVTCAVLEEDGWPVVTMTTETPMIVIKCGDKFYASESTCPKGNDVCRFTGLMPIKIKS